MRINWERALSIFDHAPPPTEVWEEQFDGFNDKLRSLATTPQGEIDFGDLWYYYLDLAYVELQPEVFAYLFPVCLMDWHLTLQANESCEHFLWGIHRGRVLEGMTTTAQQEQIAGFLCDSFLERIDAERGLRFSGSDATAYEWMQRFNSLGIVLPIIPAIWDAWWNLESVGRAVAAVQFLSGLLYFEGENPIFGSWTPDKGGGGPYLWESDNYFRTGWLTENADFLARSLTLEFAESRLKLAAQRLDGQPDHAQAQQLVDEFMFRRELFATRAAELPSLLRDPDSEDWTM